MFATAGCFHNSMSSLVKDEKSNIIDEVESSSNRNIEETIVSVFKLMVSVQLFLVVTHRSTVFVRQTFLMKTSLHDFLLQCAFGATFLGRSFFYRLYMELCNDITFCLGQPPSLEVFNDLSEFTSTQESCVSNFFQFVCEATTSRMTLQFRRSCMHDVNTKNSQYPVCTQLNNTIE